jgi:hypothetical protein
MDKPSAVMGRVAEGVGRFCMFRYEGKIINYPSGRNNRQQSGPVALDTLLGNPSDAETPLTTEGLMLQLWRKIFHL